jgi:hypothetical protein
VLCDAHLGPPLASALFSTSVRLYTPETKYSQIRSIKNFNKNGKVEKKENPFFKKSFACPIIF